MDRLLFLLMLMLIGVGIVTVYDASYALAIEKGDSFHFVKRQALWAVVGLGALLLTRRVPYWKWRGWANVGLAVSALLLLAVFVPHVGSNINGARRWIGHGQFQPSELAKLALVLYLARLLSTKPKRLLCFREGLLPPLAVIGALAALIAKEPDLGTALVLAATGLTLLFLAGARPRHMAGVVGAAGVLVGLMVAFKSYRMHRMMAFLNPKADQLHAGYQVWHGLMALGSGGITGRGLGEGRGEAVHPDGLVGLHLSRHRRGVGADRDADPGRRLRADRPARLHHRVPNADPFGALLAAGITTLISVQALINMAVATSSIPDTGVPLPFISSGGSALVLMMAGVGLLLNISTFPDGPGAAGGEGDEKPDGFEEDWNRRGERGSLHPASCLGHLSRRRGWERAAHAARGR